MDTHKKIQQTDSRSYIHSVTTSFIYEAANIKTVIFTSHGATDGIIGIDAYQHTTKRITILYMRESHDIKHHQYVYD